MSAPGCCYQCGSRTTRPHCKSPSCPWVRCTTCNTISGCPANPPGADPPDRRATFQDLPPPPGYPLMRDTPDPDLPDM